MDFDARKSPMVHSSHGSSEILIFSDKMEDTNPLLYFLQSIKNPLVTGKSTVARGFVLLICSRGARDIYPQVTVKGLSPLSSASADFRKIGNLSVSVMFMQSAVNVAQKIWIYFPSQ